MAGIPNLPVDINWGAGVATSIYWLGYGLFTFLIMGVIGLVFYFMQFKYKVTVFERGGVGDKDPHAVVKIRKDRGRVFVKKGVKKFKLFFTRKEIPPVDFEHIFPGRNIFLYQSGPEAFHPIQMKCSNPNAYFEQIPTDVSFWMGLSLREAAQDYTKKSAWDQYGNVIVMAGTILFCLILVGVTVYYTYQHANGVSSALGGVTEALKTSNIIGPQ